LNGVLIEADGDMPLRARSITQVLEPLS
jgi:hypothetical protein